MQLSILLVIAITIFYFFISHLYFSWYTDIFHEAIYVNHLQGEFESRSQLHN